MKRCPQCEFIYEDDQSHCDMDGMRLSYDSQPLPKLQGLITTTQPLEKPKWRNRSVTLSASLVLAGVLALVSWVSIQQSQKDTILPIPVSIETPEVSSTSVLSDNSSGTEETANANESESSSVNDEQGATEDESTRSDPRESAATPTVKRHNSVRASKPSTPARSRSTKEDREDSKVRSAIKKTGRFFKKALPL